MLTLRRSHGKTIYTQMSNIEVDPDAVVRNLTVGARRASQPESTLKAGVLALSSMINRSVA
jgi:hypothetical protein